MIIQNFVFHAFQNIQLSQWLWLENSFLRYFSLFLFVFDLWHGLNNFLWLGLLQIFLNLITKWIRNGHFFYRRFLLYFLISADIKIREGDLIIVRRESWFAGFFFTFYIDAIYFSFQLSVFSVCNWFVRF